ncbi:hypothetical protein [Microvirga antarctica]|uniref:hypothetical protein n=1 Tax=Microvirga antarctica TaxID=2819233 RepID=UPI001B30A70B|nr:hypothetical protein [Microvirga antarctica]
MTDYVLDGQLFYNGPLPAVYELAQGDSFASKPLSLAIITSNTALVHARAPASVTLDSTIVVDQTASAITSTGSLEFAGLNYSYLSSGSIALLSSGGFNTITLDATSAVFGSRMAIVSGGDSILTNAGKIGPQDYSGDPPKDFANGVQFLGGNNIITNEETGLIGGNLNALTILEGGNTISNGGTIANHIGPTIALGEDTANTGANYIKNDGLIINYADQGVAIESAGSFDDTVINAGTIIGAVNLGAGNDIYFSRGLQQGIVNGGDGNDRVILGQNTTRLEEGFLNGGYGADVLRGGPEKDHFMFDTPFSPQNADAIINFGVANDVLEISHYLTNLPEGAIAASAFQIGPQATRPEVRFLYDPTSGFVSFDPDGSGAAAAESIAVLGLNLALKASNFLII